MHLEDDCISTVGDLKKALENFPDDLEINLHEDGCSRLIEQLAREGDYLTMRVI